MLLTRTANLNKQTKIKWRKWTLTTPPRNLGVDRWRRTGLPIKKRLIQRTRRVRIEREEVREETTVLRRENLGHQEENRDHPGKDHALLKRNLDHLEENLDHLGESLDHLRENLDRLGENLDLGHLKRWPDLPAKRQHLRTENLGLQKVRPQLLALLILRQKTIALPKNQDPKVPGPKETALSLNPNPKKGARTKPLLVQKLEKIQKSPGVDHQVEVARQALDRQAIRIRLKQGEYGYFLILFNLKLC